ncbi:hypothetical protein KEM52_005801 [Ascosphaera acerosa]|nr:hypothetical protein KEM52_005801 [Ascosphaera acerosa]
MWDVVRVATGYLTSGGLSDHGDSSDDDPELLQRHSSLASYATSRAVYPRIWTFCSPSGRETEPTLPLLVFVHGLGGSTSQFRFLLEHLVEVAPCLAIDFPGCGLSSFAPQEWSAYTVEALAELLCVVIDQHRDVAHNQKIVLIGHSLGSAISAMLASPKAATGMRSSAEPELVTTLREQVAGLIAICPPAAPPPPQAVARFRQLLRIPSCIFDLWRKWDQRGGIASASITRFVGAQAPFKTRRLQLRFNRQSRTPVFRRMAWGALPVNVVDGEQPRAGVPDERVWAAIQAPILLVGGESDTVTPAAAVRRMMRYFGENVSEASAQLQTKRDVTTQEPVAVTSPHGMSTADDPLQKRRVEMHIFPAPATHALLYDQTTYDALIGLIKAFCAEHVDRRLDFPSIEASMIRPPSSH